VYFDKSSCTVGEGDTFTVRIAVDDIDYFVSGQLDILYDNTVLNVGADPSDGVIQDPVAGDITVDVEKGGIDGNWWDSGRMRLIFDVPWSQTIPGPPDFVGGNGTGPSGDGYLTEITFKGVGTGTCDIAFWDCATPRQINQIVGWVIHQDYSYDAENIAWGPVVQITVQ
jgi:hypothetical protein